MFSKCVSTPRQRFSQALKLASALPLGYPRAIASLPEHLMPVEVGREPLPREVMERHQRDRILPAAIEIFAKRGYPATTVDHIVAAAKTSVGSFYTLFEGKEECFLAALDRILDEAAEEIRASLPEGASQPERVFSGLFTLLRLIATDPLRARVALVEAQTAGPAALARYQATIDRVVPALDSCRGASPVAAELPETLEVATVGGLLWFLQQRIVLGEVFAPDERLPDVVEIVLEPYLGREQTQRLLAAAPA